MTARMARIPSGRESTVRRGVTGQHVRRLRQAWAYLADAGGGRVIRHRGAIRGLSVAAVESTADSPVNLLLVASFKARPGHSMASSPDDQAFEAIRSGQDPNDRLTFKAGEVSVSVTEAIVWLPFLVLFVTGWIAIVVALPPAQRQPFIGYTLGWLALVTGDLTVSHVAKAVGTLLAVLVAFVAYIWIYRWVVGRLVAYADQR